MRIRRSVTRFFGGLIIPAISAVVIGYFTYYTVWGSRGAPELSTTDTRLAMRKELLTDLRDQRQRLQHRISLLEPGSVDPDLVQELARGQLMDGGPGQVAVPRNTH